MKKIILKIVILLTLTNFPLLPQINAFCAQASEAAIIILPTNTVSQMQAARGIIEINGGRIQNIFPPSAFIGSVPGGAKASLEALGMVVSYARLNPSDYLNYGAAAQDAIYVWNQMLDKRLELQKAGLTSVEAVSARTLVDGVGFLPKLPQTTEERQKINNEYLNKWEIKKQNWQMEEKAASMSGAKDMQVALASLPGGTATIASGSAYFPFGRAAGAGYFDTSLYFTGDVAVGVFFDKGRSTTDWTPEEINQAYNTICNALNQLAVQESNAHLTFTVIKEVDPVTGLPKAPPALPFNGSFSNPTDPYNRAERDYVNGLRSRCNSHWAYMMVVYKVGPSFLTGYGAWAWVYGPSIYFNGLYAGEERIVKHETMHIFCAYDHYDAGAPSEPTLRWGYLNVVNANALHYGGHGYFGGNGEGQPDLMIDAYGPIGVYTRGQIGWRDSDGDGIMDPMDTYPDSAISNRIYLGQGIYNYTGKAVDVPLKNELRAFNELDPDPLNPTHPATYGDVTINTVTSVEYRIDGGAWIPANIQSVADNPSAKSFWFVTPLLPKGAHTVETRASNSAGNTEISYAKDTFVVDAYYTTNTAPVPTFFARPYSGSVQCNFTVNASASTDKEDGSSLLQVRWDFDNDGLWDTPFSLNKTANFLHNTSGSANIRLEVKDRGGKAANTSRNIYVAPSDLPPRPYFIVRPESVQGNAGIPVNVSFDARSSYDPEAPLSQLQSRWDFDGDGTWDINYPGNLTPIHAYLLPAKSIHYKVKLEVRDTMGQTANTTRDIWLVGYNHPPTLRAYFTEVPNLRLVAQGSDPDINTAWDGVLEYRWDANNDNVWDTKFYNSTIVELPAYYEVVNSTNLFVCEVKDRFDAKTRVVGRYYRNPRLGAIVPVNSSSFTGIINVFNTTYSDFDGNQNLQYCQFLINTAYSESGGFFASYNQNTNRLWLRSDTGSWIGNFTPGANITISNSYSELNCKNTTVTASGNNLTVKWAVRFKAGYTGMKKMFLYAKDDQNLTVGWAQKGNWTINPNLPPQLGMISPSEGASYRDVWVTINTTYSDPCGYTDLQYCQFLINTAYSESGGFFASYNQNTNRLWLRSDTGSWIGNFTPGANITISNSYSELNCKNTTVTASGNNLTVKWAVRFKAGYTGMKKMFLYAKDDQDLTVGWAQKGNWTIR